MNNAFGAPVGKLVDPSGVELKNEFSDISNQNVDDMLTSTRVQPRQVGTGVMRGTQRIVNSDGSYITLGVIPNTTPEEFGIAFFDANDNLISKDTGVTEFGYDVTNGKNNMQSKKLPDGSFGTIFMKPGFNVEDAFN